MDAPHNQVFFPSGFQELFSAWSRFPDAVLCAGATGFFHSGGGGVPVFPPDIISLDKMEDMKKISRTERYLEIGAAVRLSQIINLGKMVPEALTRCLLAVADFQVRNQATIGGNICFAARKLDACAPMAALDAQYELRTALSSRWVSASRFSSPGAGELLARIRIPLEPWTFTWYHKLGSSEGVILFVMKNEKNTLGDMRFVCTAASCANILRDKNSETMLLGKRLPLARKDAESFADKWKSYLSGTEGAALPEFTKARIINFIRATLRNISD